MVLQLLFRVCCGSFLAVSWVGRWALELGLFQVMWAPACYVPGSSMLVWVFVWVSWIALSVCFSCIVKQLSLEYICVVRCWLTRVQIEFASVVRQLCLCWCVVLSRVYCLVCITQQSTTLSSLCSVRPNSLFVVSREGFRVSETGLFEETQPYICHAVVSLKSGLVHACML